MTNKKNLYINALPAIIWLCLLVVAFIANILKIEAIGNFIGTGYIFLLFIVPLFYGIYNYFIADRIEEMFKLYAISAASQLIGLTLNGVLYYSFISSDSETWLVIQVYLLITLVCTIIIDLITILIKIIDSKLRK